MQTLDESINIYSLQKLKTHFTNLNSLNIPFWFCFFHFIFRIAPVYEVKRKMFVHLSKNGQQKVS